MGSFTGIPKSKVGGIYMILNIDNRKVYIGQTRNFQQRAYSHSSNLRTGKHPNKAMQADYNNGNRMRFVPLERVDSGMSNEDRRIREYMHMLLFIDCRFKLYNSENKERIKGHLFWMLVSEQTRKIQRKIYKDLDATMYAIRERNPENVETLSNKQIA